MNHDNIFQLKQPEESASDALVLSQEIENWLNYCYPE